MSRPASGRNGKKTNLYLSEDLTCLARKRGSQHGWSLSELVERLLIVELEAPQGIAFKAASRSLPLLDLSKLPSKPPRAIPAAWLRE